MPVPQRSPPVKPSSDRTEKLVGPPSCAAVPTLTISLPVEARPYADAGAGTAGSASCHTTEPVVGSKRAVVNLS
jgi:hypothetical protein